MKQERQKMRAKNKEPKEEIIVDLGERKNKTVKNNRNEQSDSSGLNFEDVSNEEGRPFTKENSENIHQSEDLANNVYHEESVDARSKW